MASIAEASVAEPPVSESIAIDSVGSEAILAENITAENVTAEAVTTEASNADASTTQSVAAEPVAAESADDHVSSKNRQAAWLEDVVGAGEQFRVFETFSLSELEEDFPHIEAWYNKYRETRPEFPPWPARVFGLAAEVAEAKEGAFVILYKHFEDLERNGDTKRRLLVRNAAEDAWGGPTNWKLRRNQDMADVKAALLQNSLIRNFSAFLTIMNSLTPGRQPGTWGMVIETIVNILAARHGYMRPPPQAADAQSTAHPDSDDSGDSDEGHTAYTPCTDTESQSTIHHADNSPEGEDPEDPSSSDSDSESTAHPGEYSFEGGMAFEEALQVQPDCFIYPDDHPNLSPRGLMFVLNFPLCAQPQWDQLVGDDTEELREWFEFVGKRNVDDVMDMIGANQKNAIRYLANQDRTDKFVWKRIKIALTKKELDVLFPDVPLSAIEQEIENPRAAQDAQEAREREAMEQGVSEQPKGKNAAKNKRKRNNKKQKKQNQKNASSAESGPEQNEGGQTEELECQDDEAAVQPEAAVDDSKETEHNIVEEASAPAEKTNDEDTYRSEELDSNGNEAERLLDTAMDNAKNDLNVVEEVSAPAEETNDDRTYHDEEPKGNHQDVNLQQNTDMNNLTESNPNPAEEEATPAEKTSDGDDGISRNEERRDVRDNFSDDAATLYGSIAPSPSLDAIPSPPGEPSTTVPKIDPLISRLIDIDESIESPSPDTVENLYNRSHRGHNRSWSAPLHIDMWPLWHALN